MRRGAPFFIHRRMALGANRRAGIIVRCVNLQVRVLVDFEAEDGGRARRADAKHQHEHKRVTQRAQSAGTSGMVGLHRAWVTDADSWTEKFCGWVAAGSAATDVCLRRTTLFH